MKGMQLVNFNKLWALIEFESPGDEQLNPLITYKIRYAVYVYVCKLSEDIGIIEKK